MVVVIGAGITGAATAYYLSKSNSDITIIDAVGAAASSSGKAGAFLSESWGDGTRTEALHHKSFQLHLQLADELGLMTFRTMSAFRMNLEEDPECRTPVSGQHAQVDPAELTNALLDAAKERGAKLGIGSVEGLNTEDGRVISVCLESGINVPVKDDLVVAMGPWSCRVEDWLDIPVPVDGVLSTSLVWDNLEHDLEAAALFCEDDSNGCHLEIIPRPNKSLYLSGCGESQTMSPATLRGPHRPKPGEELPSQSRAMAAQKSIRTLNFVADLPPDDVRACIRPAAPDGMPIVGKVIENVYVATGGGPWGITWGPLMGLMVASMIQGDDLPMRALSMNPGRFDTMIYRTLLEQRGKEAWRADKER